MARRSSSALILLAAAYLVTRALLVWRFPVFWDEGGYAGFVSTARHDFGSYAFIALLDEKGPLQTWLGVPLNAIGFSAVTSVRLLSVAAGAGTVALVWAITRATTTGAAALIAALLAVALPMFLLVDSIGLAEGLVMLVYTAAILLELRLAREPTLRNGIWLGVVVGLGLLVKVSALQALMLLAFSLLLAERGAYLRWLRAAALAVVIALALDAIERLSSFYGHAEQVSDQHFRSPADIVRHFASYASDNASVVYHAFVGYTGIPLLLAAALGVWALAKQQRPRQAAFLVVALALPVLLVLVTARYPYPRYLSPALPPLAILAAAGVVAVADRLAQRGIQPRMALALTTAAAIALPVELSLQMLDDPNTARYPSVDYWQYVSGWPAGTGLDRAAAALKRAAPPGRVDVAADHVYPYGFAAALGDIVFHIKDGHRDPHSPLEVTAGKTTFRFIDRPSKEFHDAPFIFHIETLDLGADLNGAYDGFFGYRRPGPGVTLELARQLR